MWKTLALVAILPDLDAIGRPFGHGDLAFLGGHRALTHSATAAGVLSLAATAYLRRRADSPMPFPRLWVAVFLATLTHGVLDACTSYGRGVAWFAPWSALRIRMPWTPLSGFLSDAVLFLLAALIARIVLQARGWPLPRGLALNRRAPAA